MTPDGTPAGLYLHVPFCSRVCPYCDFAVRTGDAARRRRFVDHLVDEIGLWGDWDTPFDTIYFGGGTPSLLDPDDLRRILDAAATGLPFAPRPRIFLEANPEDATRERLAAWRDLGVATLSLGVQAFDGAALSFLGRRHDGDDARRAIALAREAGFETVSIDLIYGLPDQSDGAWVRELDGALAAGIDHLSCYQLTVHEGTRFGLLARRGRLVELPDERQGELFRLTHRHVNARGLAGYEVSQFAASEGHRSRHNLKYWCHAPYLGLGPSAHSHHTGRRWWNLRRADAWQTQVAGGARPIEEEECLDAGELALEALMTGLRTYAGVDTERVRERCGIDLLAPNAGRVAEFVRDGLLTLRGSVIVPSLDGLAVADALARQFEIPSGR